jgi:stage V sporulation protein G
MKITDIRIRRLEGNSKMKAIVSITIDDEFVLHDIKVVDGEKGLFIAMPSKKTSDGEYRDIAHPIKTETRNRIQTLILDRYSQEDEVPESILTGAV